MSKNVFANGNEISAKNDDNKSIAAMPDVCLTPPTPPAGPIPIPYPNFSEAKDTADGSKTVQIGGAEVGLKDKSNYKQSKGDEAATKSQGMGVMTATIQGKTYHAAWSMDVIFEGENVIRHLDITTHNHNCPPQNTGSTTVDVGGMSVTVTESQCEELGKKNDSDRSKMENDDRSTYSSIGEETTTITNATLTTPSGTTNMKACSRALASKFDPAFVPGLEPGPNKEVNEKSKLCADAKKKFKYEKTGSADRPHTSHTESRLLETALAGMNPGEKGVMVMNINWNKKPIPSDQPCKHCKRLICAAQEVCGITILLCQGEDGKPKKPEKPDC